MNSASFKKGAAGVQIDVIVPSKVPFSFCVMHQLAHRHTVHSTATPILVSACTLGDPARLCSLLQFTLHFLKRLRLGKKHERMFKKRRV